MARRSGKVHTCETVQDTLWCCLKIPKARKGKKEHRLSHLLLARLDPEPPRMERANREEQEVERRRPERVQPVKKLISHATTVRELDSTL